jgi:hypothetical protein
MQQFMNWKCGYIKPNTSGAKIGFKLKICDLREFADFILICTDQVGLPDIPAVLHFHVIGPNFQLCQSRLSASEIC